MKQQSKNGVKLNRDTADIFKSGSGDLGVDLIFNSARELMFVADVDGICIRPTASFVALMNGIDPVGMSIRELIEWLAGERMASHLVDRFNHALSSNQAVKSDDIFRAEGSGCDYRASFTPISDDGGSICAMIVRLLDVTSLVSAQKTAENVRTAKGDFLFTMSHEMRTPMNAIIGMAHMARLTTDVAKKDYCLKRIDESSKHLMSIINDVLDMSQIESGRLELNYAEFNFEKMLMDVSNFVVMKGEEKRLFFNVSVDPNVPLHIIADEQRLTQVLMNLLDNAAKFTPEDGTIDLIVKTAKRTGHTCVLQFDIKDSGIGMTKEQVEKLFISFQQLDNSASRQFGGVGLGLAISQYIVSMMDGAIRVESEPGKGSSFSFTVCVQVGEAERTNAEPAAFNWKDVSVLVIDDSVYIRSYFKNISSVLGFECDVADGINDVRKLLRQPGVHKYDIVFVDYIMPEVNGIELTSILRKSGCDKAVVIMMSTADWDVMEVDALAAGVNRFLYKPLFTSTIIECLEECLEANVASARISAEHERNNISFSDYCVLIVEDIEINREILMVLLEPTGIQMDYAVNGRQALEMVQAAPDRYDLILMDIQMPEMDGIQATQRIRALNHERARNIPIIAMTANVFAEDLHQYKQMGINDHISKPIDPAQIADRLSRFLKTPD